ncbi:MAG: cysteine desulfurase family protein [Bdellovibrionales bacterium]
MESTDNSEWVYLDHNATTPLNPHVQAVVINQLSQFGNPSSIHWAGRKSKTILRKSRESLARFLNASPLELIFTSGGSESNNTVIQGVFSTSNKNEFICSAVEHPSVLKTMKYIESQGARVHRIPVNRNGQLDLEFYKKHCGPQTALVSVMAANNETGTVFPIEEMVKIAHSQGALFHTDAVQTLGKLKIDLKKWNVDYASFSAHKFYALKGVGLLYAKKGVPQIPLIHGGAQERFRRGGTENILGVASFGAAAQTLSQEVEKNIQRSLELRNHMETEIQKNLPGVKIVANLEPRLTNTSSLLIEGIDGETLLISLDIKGFAVSTGAACSSGNPEPSPVLLAMGFSRSEAQTSLRVSLGWESTEVQVQAFIDELISTVLRLRKLNNSQVNLQETSIEL